MLELARQEIFTSDYDAMRGWAERALETAKAVGEPTLTASSAALLALAHAFLGDAAPAATASAEAATYIEAIADGEVAVRLDAAIHLASALFYLDRLEAASAHAERAFALARTSGHVDLILTAFGIVGNIRLARGDIAGAAEFFDAAVETSRLTDNAAQLISWNLVNRSLVASTAGDTQAALIAIEESDELAALSGVALAWSGMAQAEVLLADGEPARGAAALVAAAGETTCRTSRAARACAGSSC